MPKLVRCAAAGDGRRGYGALFFCEEFVVLSLQAELPKLENEQSEMARQLIADLNDMRPFAAPVRVVR